MLLFARVFLGNLFSTQDRQLLPECRMWGVKWLNSVTERLWGFGGGYSQAVKQHPGRDRLGPGLQEVRKWLQRAVLWGFAPSPGCMWGFPALRSGARDG